jgi:hypothetical protein
MTEKLTPEEIKKGLECCGSPEGDSCFYCPFSGSPLEYCTTKLHTEAVALINHQQAEIERLRTENNQFADIGKMYSEIRAEAIKEFAESLKKEVFRKEFHTAYGNIEMIGAGAIDNLVKEMVGEQE